MELTQKYKKIVLHNEPYVTIQREPGDAVRKIGVFSIDRSVFKKTAKEKELLKLAKLNCKLLDLKR
jgi:hypothetical protein